MNEYLKLDPPEGRVNRKASENIVFSNKRHFVKSNCFPDYKFAIALQPYCPNSSKVIKMSHGQNRKWCQARYIDINHTV